MRKLDEMTDELRGELRRGDYLLAPGESAFPPKIRAALQEAYDLGRAERDKEWREIISEHDAACSPHRDCDCAADIAWEGEK